MIPFTKFYDSYQSLEGYPPDDEKKAIIEAPPEKALQVVAGPGTGKTAVLTLRILKLVLIDRLDPASIMATTFTNKAAEELRSRVLGWGFGISEILLHDDELSQDDKDWIGSIDINQVITGTIDSICEMLIREYRLPGTHPPILADDFIAKTLMLRNGLLNNGRYNNQDLDQLLLQIYSGGGSPYGYFIKSKNEILYEIWSRKNQDLIRWDEFINESPAHLLIEDSINDYLEALNEKNLIDFPLLEKRAFDLLRSGDLKDFTDTLNVILVDEYQDTNYLQESIYFELASACNGAMNVVGDDDQSLYRFRGATVRLFTEFSSRFQARFQQSPQINFLSTNYRSSRNIIEFVNKYATLDHTYQQVRVQNKPPLVSAKGEGVPILAMIRPNINDLATDLSDFLNQVFVGQGFTLPSGEIITVNTESGAIGDCAFLSSTPAELKFNGQPRLPGLLRTELADNGLEIFNPRGQDFQNLRLVQIIGGLAMLALDPTSQVLFQITNRIGQANQQIINSWAMFAQDYLDDDPPEGLTTYIQGWMDRDPHKGGYKWPKSIAFIDFLYGMQHFFPQLYNSPEGQIYLEVFTRQLTACSLISNFEGRLVHDETNPDLSRKSLEHLITDFINPIASGVVGINEDLMESFPRNSLNVLSIHQSKGLEFPMVIVDVASDFSRNHAAQAFKRFPTSGSRAHRMEDLLWRYSDIGVPNRTVLNRSFDDLIRQFFVAYSRPENVLLMVGLEGSFPPGTIQNIATGYDRDGANHWLQDEPFIRI